MIFEPSKRTYYRFPSTTSIHDLDSRNYFPDNLYAGTEDTRLKAHAPTDLAAQDDFIKS